MLRTVLRYEAGRARRLLGSAAPLTRQLPLQPRIAVCGFAAGGMAALDAIEAAKYDVLAAEVPAPPAAPRRAPGRCAGDGIDQEGGVNTETAYRACEEITRREAKNFAYGIRLLRVPERHALSSGLRPGPADRRHRRRRGRPGAEARRAGAGPSEPRTRSTPGSDDPVLVAVAAAASRYQLPLGAFGELIDGCENDVRGTSYDTFDDLVVYCRLVAGSIGRLSLAVFGATDPHAVQLADDLGVALQLTNILRDVVEDRGNGRVYLPAADAIDGRLPTRPQRAARADAGRAGRLRVRAGHEWFERGLQLLPLLDRRSRACVGAMAGIYHRLLAAHRARPHAGDAAAGSPCPRPREGLDRRQEPGRSPTVSRPTRRGRRRGTGRDHRRARRWPTPEPRSRSSSGAAGSGGLTWSFQRNGLSFDNGQHVFLRCCTAYLRFLDRIGARDAVHLQPRLDVPVLAPDGDPGLHRPRLAAARRCTSLGSLARYRHLDAARPAPAGLARAGLAPARPRRPCARHGHLRRLALAGTARAPWRSTASGTSSRCRPSTSRPPRPRWRSPSRCSAPASSIRPTPATSGGRRCRSTELHGDVRGPRARRGGGGDRSSGPRSQQVAALDGERARGRDRRAEFTAPTR